MADDKHAWVRKGLMQRRFRAKDLARAWGISESSVSRFLAGEEQQDLPLSRAVSLASMLGVSLDELASGLGFKGRVFEPTVPVENGHTVPMGTLTVSLAGSGRVRVVLAQEMDAAIAGELLKLVAVSGGAGQ